MDDGFVLGSCAQLKVVGLGGGGSNAVDRMIDVGVQGVEFVALNTDAQALGNSSAPVRMRIGDATTGGRGCGANPSVGERAAQESSEEIEEILRGADMVFITAGMGGGTGTGGAPIVAQIARKLGALTVAVVTKPFAFEGTRRMRLALEGIGRLREQVDTLIVIPNDRLLEVVDPKASVRDAFLAADDLLRQGIQGISDLVTVTGLINVDFNDVRSIMGNGGTALMSIGYGQGDARAVDAVMGAVNSRLLDVSIDGAKGVLFNIKGSPDMALAEVNDAADIIRKMVDPEANIIFGAAIEESLTREIQITLIATGFDGRVSAQPQLAQVSRGKTIAFPLRSFDKADMDIPSFLRSSAT